MLTYKNPKAKPCEVCKTLFVPDRMGQVVCRPACAMKKVRQAKMEERAKIKTRKEAIKKISTLESECRKIVQEIARIRDRNDGCISCHMGPNYGGIWHGSHYRAHGGCSSLQFNLWNIHKACEQCNYFKGGNREGFIKGLLIKPGYGPERIEWLDNQPKSQKFSREYLYRFKEVMGKRLRRMRKLKEVKA
ncbi:recombination protein NinG [Acidovorax sp. BL-A-41-H1]|uniref:recombination protein NinG n=1 Tax=Acidovorax sp. BL-A-41-H1 TaxID=3421102 RepID=UPI003F7B1871